MTLVDTSVLLDVVNEDPRWFDWSARELEKAADSGDLGINPIIFAEISVQFDRIEEIDEVIPPGVFRRLALPWEAAFLAGKCFRRYRKKGGSKTSLLPDFYIGAHAAVSGFTFLTRDERRYTSYFPRLDIVSP